MVQTKKSYPIALGGVMAALAVTLQCLGGLIPVATYVTPMLCCIGLTVVLNLCGRRIAWAWYGAVAILSLLMAPDKEAAAVFVFLGYYPILKPRFDGLKFPLLWKALYFNAVILILYRILLYVIGLASVREDLLDAGSGMIFILLLLGNVVFYSLDKILEKPIWRLRYRG